MKQLPKLTVEIKSVMAEHDAIGPVVVDSAKYKTYEPSSVTYTAELARGGFLEITAEEFDRLFNELREAHNAY